MSDVTAKLAEALRKTKELAEYWFTREDRRGYSESEYKLWHSLGFGSNTMQQAREALAAYEQAQAEPVAWLHPTHGHMQRRTDNMTPEIVEAYRKNGWTLLYAAPVAQAELKPLTDEQIAAMAKKAEFTTTACYSQGWYRAQVRAIEAAHGIGANTGSGK